MSFKEAVSGLVNGKQAELLYEFVSQNQLSKASGTEVCEVLVTLTLIELNILWDSLELICESTFLTQFDDNSTEDDQLKGSRLLNNIVTIALKTIVPELQVVPEGLLSTVLLLKGLLVDDLPAKYSKLKNKIASLGETWWHLKKQGYEAIGGSTVLFILKKLFSEPLVKVDVKRLWNLRDALHLIKSDNQFSLEVKKHLNLCSISIDFLGVDVGPKFISHSLLLNEDILEELHLTIKNNLSTWTQKQAKMYGEIYHRAWKSAIGGLLQQKLESWCIQDIMQMAMLIDRSTGLFAAVKTFLHYFHMQRNDGTTEMLVRLYEPILWRHLKVPNADVRANAAAIFFSAFPLEVKREMDNANLLEKQYVAMKDLIWDHNPCVRATAITGICDACTDYWELMPPSTIQSLLTIFTDHMMYDSTSYEVRAAVSLGFAHLLDNPLSHPFLQSLLPKLRLSFHDTSEQVRIALLELLLKSKGMKPFQFWDVVPLEDLLQRLKTDSQPVKKRIMKLIIDSFFPEEATKMVQLHRCIRLISMDRRVSLSFYSQLCDFKDAKNIIEFMRFICRYLKRLLKRQKESSENTNGSMSINNSRHAQEDEDSDSGKTTDEDSRGQNDELLKNPAWIGGLVDIVSVIWPKLLKQKLVAAGTESYQKMQAAMSALLPLLVTLYKDTPIWNSVLFFGSYVSPKSGSGHILDKYCMSRLRGLPATAKVSDYNFLLSSLFQWGCDEEVIELLTSWLDAGLNINSKSSQQLAGRRRVRFQVPCIVQPGLACEILTWLLRDPFCRTKLCTTRIYLQSCWNQLHPVMKVIERRLKEGRVPNPILTTDEFLVEAFCLYCRLSVHLSKTASYNPLQVYDDIFIWAECELLPCFQRSSDTSSNTSTRASVRLAQRYHSTLAKNLVQTLLLVCGDMLLTGIATFEFCKQLTSFIKPALSSACDLNLTIAASMVMFHFLDFSKTHNLEDLGTYKKLMSELFSCIVHSTALVLSTFTEFLPEKLKLLKVAITEMLLASHRQGQDSPEAILQMTSVGCALISNMNDVIEKECGYTAIDDKSDLPVVAQFLLSILFTKASFVSSLLNHFQYVLSSDLIRSPSKILSVVAILHIVGHHYDNVSMNALQASVLAAQQVVQDSQSALPVNLSDSSLAIEKDYVLTAEQLLEELTKKT